MNPVSIKNACRNRIHIAVVLLLAFIACSHSPENKSHPGKTNRVGHVDRKIAGSIDELWKADNLGKLVTLDFSCFPDKFYAGSVSRSGVKLGDVSGVELRQYECYGQNKLLEKRGVISGDPGYSHNKIDTFFLSNWEIMIAADTGKKLLNFEYGTKRIRPIFIDEDRVQSGTEERFNRFVQGDSSMLCGYLVNKDPYYIEGPDFCRFCKVQDSLKRLHPSRPPLNCSSFAIEIRQLIIIPVGYTYR
jgi:hypothetical protein